MLTEETLDKLAFQFFKLFAQYEAYLKEHGFFKADKSGNIFVDWDRFANEVIGKDFQDRLGESSESAKFILDNPPNKQIYDGSKVIWSVVSQNEKSIQILFGHICRVRNNLFHGAKFNGTWNDPVRSEKLLRCSLDVLLAFRNQLNF